MHPEKSAVMLVRWWNGDRLQRVRSLRASTHPGVICRGRRHSGLEYPDEKSNGTSYRTLLLHLWLLIVLDGGLHDDDVSGVNAMQVDTNNIIVATNA